MADYFTNLSLVLNLPDEAAQTYALELAHHASGARQGNELPDDFPKPLTDVIDDWDFETESDSSAEGHGLWFHSDCGGVDALCAFLQHLLQRFDPGRSVTFEWSHDCSKPRTDAYGGGAAVITAHEIKTFNTGQWLRETANSGKAPAA